MRLRESSLGMYIKTIMPADCYYIINNFFKRMASIKFLLGKYLPIHFSAGSIINKKWVITSAHTITEYTNEDYYNLLKILLTFNL